MSEAEDLEFDLEGANLSLADIANLDMEDFAEHRGAPFPKCIAQLEVKEAVLDTVGPDDNKIPAAVCVFKVLGLKNPVLGEHQTVEDLIGSDYNQSFLIFGAKSIGAIRAMVADTGGDSGGKFTDMLGGWVGTKFECKIYHKPSKNDEDMVNARISMRKIKPLVSE